MIVTFLFLRWQSRPGGESPEAIEAQVGRLRSELRWQVRSCSYGARSKLIAVPLKELDLDITLHVGRVRDLSLTESETLPERTADVVAAFGSSKGRLLIVGEPGSGKTTAAYDLIEHLDETECAERILLPINLSPWESQEDFEAFLIDYLCSEVGYRVRRPPLPACSSVLANTPSSSTAQTKPRRAQGAFLRTTGRVRAGIAGRGYLGRDVQDSGVRGAVGCPTGLGPRSIGRDASP